MISKHTIPAVIAALATGTLLQAQWSSDPGTPVDVAAGTLTQTAEFIVPMTDGGCYVAWYEAMSPMPGAPTEFRVQRLDSRGNGVWPNGGSTLTSGRATIGIDADDNLLLLYSVDNVGSNAFSLTKLAKANGNEMWQPGGVFVGTTTANLAFESVAGLTDGSAVVSWITNDRTQVILRRYDSGGFIDWTTTMTPPVMGSRTLGASLMAGPNGCVFAVLAFFNGQPVNSPLLLRGQKIDSAGANLWNIDQITISNTGSAVAWETENDGNGGLVVAWATNTETSVQRVSGAGSAVFSIGGVAVSTDSSKTRSSMEMRFDETTQETMVVYREEGAGGDGVGLQRFDATGARLEGLTGQTVLAPTTAPLLSVHAADVRGGVLAAWNRTIAGNTETIEGTILDATGTELVAPFAIATATSNKDVKPVIGSSLGHAILAFTDDGAGDDDVLAQNVLADGSLGGLGTATPRNGSGINPNVFSSLTPPSVGTLWNIQVVLGATDVASGFVIHPAADPGTIVPGFGEALVDLTTTTLIGVTNFTPGPVHAYLVTIPPSPGLVGLTFYAQGLIATQSLSIQLTNALDIAIGL